MLFFEQTPRTTAHSIFFKTKGKCWYYTVCSSLILMKRPTLTTHFFTIDAMVFTYSLPSSSIWYGILLNCTTTTTGSFLIKKKFLRTALLSSSVTLSLLIVPQTIGIAASIPNHTCQSFDCCMNGGHAWSTRTMVSSDAPFL